MSKGVKNYVDKEQSSKYINISGINLYNEFVKYCNYSNIENIISSTLFGVKIKKYNYIMNVKRSSKGIIYTIKHN